jgi:hypothetical protein
MATLGVVPAEQDGVEFFVIGARSNQRWYLIPTHDWKATMAGLEMLQPTSWKAKALKLLVQWLFLLVPGFEYAFSRFRLSALPDFGENFCSLVSQVVCYTGTDGPHRKTTLQILGKNATVLGYAKVSCESHVRSYLRNEGRVLRQLSELNLTTADVPSLLEIRDDYDSTMLITDCQVTSKHKVGSNPSKKHLAFLTEMRSNSSIFGGGELLDWLKAESTRLEVTAGSIWTSRFADIGESLESSAEAIELCMAHGDFTPWNCFEQAERLYVFDWEYAQESWPLGFDLTHFYLATVEPVNQPALVPFLLDVLSDEYFEGDRRRASASLLLSLACHAAWAVARLHEAGLPLASWSGSEARAAMIDQLLADSS